MRGAALNVPEAFLSVMPIAGRKLFKRPSPTQALVPLSSVLIPSLRIGDATHATVAKLNAVPVVDFKMAAPIQTVRVGRSSSFAAPIVLKPLSSKSCGMATGTT